MEVLFTAAIGDTLNIDITTSVDNSTTAGTRCSTV
jgi:malonate decarboxylase delta subunit